MKPGHRAHGLKTQPRTFYERSEVPCTASHHCPNDDVSKREIALLQAAHDFYTSGLVLLFSPAELARKGGLRPKERCSRRHGRIGAPLWGKQWTQNSLNDAMALNENQICR